ncbi:MAG TPA: hypothetical protein VF221_16045 [Chloroflexota bacterium]
MLRFKQFVGSGAEVEEAVNTWLAETEPDVTQMVQSVDGGAVTLSFLFEESFRGQELRYSSERGMRRGSEPAMPANTIPDEPIRVPIEP